MAHSPCSIYSRFYQMIQAIPYGRVATYGQIARMAGYPGYARQVGYALHSLPPEWDIPWHRVINARGRISRRSDPVWEALQKDLLQSEGIQFDEKDRILLPLYQWDGR